MLTTYHRSLSHSLSSSLAPCPLHHPAPRPAPQASIKRSSVMTGFWSHSLEGSKHPSGNDRARWITPTCYRPQHYNCKREIRNTLSRKGKRKEKISHVVVVVGSAAGSRHFHTYIEGRTIVPPADALVCPAPLSSSIDDHIRQTRGDAYGNERGLRSALHS